MEKRYLKDDYLETREAADYIGYSANTLPIWRWKKKNLPYRKKNNGRVEYKVADLDKFRDRNQCIDIVVKA